MKKERVMIFINIFRGKIGYWRVELQRLEIVKILLLSFFNEYGLCIYLEIEVRRFYVEKCRYGNLNNGYRN